MEKDFDAERILKNGLIVLVNELKKATIEAEKYDGNHPYHNGKYDAYWIALKGFGFSTDELDEMVLKALEEN